MRTQLRCIQFQGDKVQNEKKKKYEVTFIVYVKTWNAIKRFF